MTTTRESKYTSSSKIPRLIYGTAFKDEAQTKLLVKQALTLGYRGIDTANVRNNYKEAEAGDAIRELIRDGVVRREDLYIQTKFTPYKPGRPPSIYPYDTTSSLSSQISSSIASSLSHFTIPSSSPSPTSTPTAPYLDTVLLHSPLPTSSETLRAYLILSHYVPSRIHHLDISNVDLPLLRQLYDHATVKPSVVQNRFAEDVDPTGKLPVPTPIDPFDEEVRMFCREKGIRYQPWGVVWGNERLKASRVVREIGEVLGVNGDVALYLVVLSLGEVSVFVGSKRVDRMRAAVEGVRVWEEWMKKDGAAEKWGEWMRRVGEESGLT